MKTKHVAEQFALPKLGAEKTKFSTTKLVAITINVTEIQREALRRCCVKYGAPGVPPARMASTAFTRGLGLLVDEIGIELPEADYGRMIW